MALTLAAGLIVAAGAEAHAVLLESAPGPHTLVVRPDRIVLRFNDRIEKRGSRVRVTDAGGRTLDLPILDEGPPEEVRAAVVPLPPGRVHVEWHVLSTDGHALDGAFTFRVGP